MTSLSIRERMAAARGRASEYRREQEERQREAEERRQRLPQALCAACGGIVAQGEGIGNEPSPWRSQEQVQTESAIDVNRRNLGLAPVLGWRRRHSGCERSDQVVKAVLGVALAPEVAGQALAAVHGADWVSSSISAQYGRPRPDGARRSVMAKDRGEQSFREASPVAWVHVSADDRVHLEWAVDRARADVEPRKCTSGACSWCGVATSIGWHSGPETWADGSEAPLCTTCFTVWRLRGRPTDDDGRRACALESLSGANNLGSDGLGIRIYADFTGGHGGHPEPWTYAVEPLDRLRERARMMWPGSLLDPALRDEYVAKAGRASREALEAAWAAGEAEDAERAMAEAEAMGWPV